jgi:hypothetical protein
MIENTIELILFILLFTSFFSYYIRYYDFKEFYFWLLGKKYGINNIIYFKELNKNNINLINKVLCLKDKGKFIEYSVATPAWEPIISLESVDNDTWDQVKRNFLNFITCFHVDNKINLIGNYIENYINDYLNSNHIIDSKLISKITVQSFCKFLFDVEINVNELDVLFQASLEWRKEISIKGKGNMDIKRNAINIILNYIKNNNKLYLIFNENWEKPEYYSVILQPFIISPMINISDIMVSAQSLLSQSLISNNEVINNNLINKIIYSYHPFPILERFDPSTNTQYFIPLDQLTRFHNYSDLYKNVVFGSGPRRCSGQLYAYVIINKFIDMYLKNQKKFNPILNHKYSGRNNDTFNLGESLYMGKILLQILFSSRK